MIKKISLSAIPLILAVILLFTNYSSVRAVAGPTGSIQINNGAAATNNHDVLLSITYYNASSVMIADDPGMTNGQIIDLLPGDGQTTQAWTLPSGTGSKTVYAQFYDGNSLPSSQVSASINVLLDPVLINNGAATTNSINVKLYISNDIIASGYTDMMFSNDSSFSGTTWEPIAATKDWTLTTGDGTKTVFVQFMDLNVFKTNASASIILDTSIGGNIIINKKLDGTGADFANASLLNLTLSSTNAAKMLISTSSNTPTAADPRWETYSPTKSWSYTGPDGVVTLFAWYMDGAGNISSVTSDDIVFDKTPPTGNIAINGGALTTAQATVSLSFTKSYDYADVKQIEVSNSPDFTNKYIMDYSNILNTWNIDTAFQGTKVIYARYIDWAGNVSSIFEDSIDFAGINTTTVTTKQVTDSAVEVSKNNARTIAKDSNGNLYTVFIKVDSTGKKNVFVKMSTDGGETWKAWDGTSFSDITAVPIATESYDQASPAIAVDLSNNVHVVWSGKSSLSIRAKSYNEIKYSYFNGTSWSEPKLVTDVNYNQSSPSIDIDSANKAHIAWLGRTSGTVDQVMYTSSGTWAVEQVTNATVSQEAPSIAVDGGNGLHMVWAGKDTGGIKQINISKKDTTSGTWPIQRLTDDSSNKTGPTIAITDSNNIHVVWTGSTTTTVTYATVHYQTDGGLVKTVVQIGDGTSPVIAIDGAKNVHVIFHGGGKVKQAKVVPDTTLPPAVDDIVDVPTTPEISVPKVIKDFPIIIVPPGETMKFTKINFAPQGIIKINVVDGKEAQYANASPLHLMLNATSKSGAVKYVYITDQEIDPAGIQDSDWKLYPESGVEDYSYTGEDKVLTLYAWFKDETGNVSAEAATDDITFDANGIGGTIGGPDSTNLSTVTLSITKNYNPATDFADAETLRISRDNFATYTEYPPNTTTLNNWPVNTTEEGATTTIKAQYIDYAGNPGPVFDKIITYTNTGSVYPFEYLQHNQLIYKSGTPVELQTPTRIAGADEDDQTLSNWNIFENDSPVRYKVKFKIKDNMVNNIEKIHVVLKPNTPTTENVQLPISKVSLGPQTLNVTAFDITDISGGDYEIIYSGILKIDTNIHNTGEERVRNVADITVYFKDGTPSTKEVVDLSDASNKYYIDTRITRLPIKSH